MHTMLHTGAERKQREHDRESERESAVRLYTAGFGAHRRCLEVVWMEFCLDATYFSKPIETCVCSSQTTSIGPVNPALPYLHRERKVELLHSGFFQEIFDIGGATEGLGVQGQSCLSNRWKSTLCQIPDQYFLPFHHIHQAFLLFLHEAGRSMRL